MTATPRHNATTPPAAGEEIPAMLRDLTGTPFGGLLAWGLTCALAGAIPILIWDVRGDDYGIAVFFAWILHLIVAGIGLWGIAFVLLHVWCLHSLIYTEDSRLRALAGAFLSQLTVSTIATGFLAEDISTHAIGAWVLACALLLPFVLRPLFGGNARTAGSRQGDRCGRDAHRVALKAFLLQGWREKMPVFSRKRMRERARVTAILRSKVRQHFFWKGAL